MSFTSMKNPLPLSVFAIIELWLKIQKTVFNAFISVKYWANFGTATFIPSYKIFNDLLIENE